MCSVVKREPRQITAFSANVYYDAKLLSGNRILLSDCSCREIRMYDTQGKHICSYTCDFQPVCLAVIDSTGNTVAVTTYQSVEILHVSAEDIKLKASIPTEGKRYKAVAATDTKTLALGFWEEPGIEFMDVTTEQIIRRLKGVSPEMGYPINMVATRDGYLVCSNFIDTIIRINVATGETQLLSKGLLVFYNRGIAVDQDGNVLWTQRDSQQLHRLSPVPVPYAGAAGGWRDEVLWQVPYPRVGDELWGVDVRDGICLCVTKQGHIFCRY